MHFWMDLQKLSLFTHFVFRKIIFWSNCDPPVLHCSHARFAVTISRAVLWLVFHSQLYRFSVGDVDVHNPQDVKMDIGSTLAPHQLWLVLTNGSTGPVMHQCSFKKPSVKADLAIYSHVLDVSRQYMSVSLILGFKLDFSSNVNWDDFANPVMFIKCIFKLWMHMCTIHNIYTYNVYIHLLLDTIT